MNNSLLQQHALKEYRIFLLLPANYMLPADLMFNMNKENDAQIHKSLNIFGHNLNFLSYILLLQNTFFNSEYPLVNSICTLPHQQDMSYCKPSLIAKCGKARILARISVKSESALIEILTPSHTTKPRTLPKASRSLSKTCIVEREFKN